MSRSGYTDEWDNSETWEMAMWRGAVRSAMCGKRGQAFLREMRDALDAMPVKQLIAYDLVTPEGECCALGAVALKRGLDASDVDETDRAEVASVFGIATAMAAEIAYTNDEDGPWDGLETPAARWVRVRAWVEGHITDGKGG